MPVSHTISKIDHYRAIVFEVTEPLAFFREKIRLSAQGEGSFLALRHPGRQIEILASRYALHLASGSTDVMIIKKDAFGKPFLPDTDLHISLSHTRDFVAAMVSPRPCGIDIQRYDMKILKLAKKFLDQNELESKPIDRELSFLTHCWAIKEAAYKTYGKKGLDFRENIKILDMEFGESVWKSRVLITKNEYTCDYLVEGITSGTFVLAVCLEA